MKVVISRPIPGAAVELLKQAGHTVRVLDAHRPDEEFQAALAEADGVIPLLSDTLDARIIRQSGHLRAIANYAVGFNNIDLAAATGAGIVVTNTPDVLTDATADTALVLILMTMRRVRESERLLRDGLFKGWKPDVQLGLDLAGKNLGILGMGRIGQAVARRAEAFGMKILYHTRSGGKASLPYPHVSFETLLAESDVLSLHLPLTDMTRHLIGEAELKRMKKTAVLINTARGPIVDEAALAAALHNGTIYAAGLDVYEREPEIHPELLTAENAVLLPHIGSQTIETRSAMAATAARALIEALEGRRPALTVNPAVFDTPIWRGHYPGK
ncbi:MAG TPA: D-glycerate dehydrogenase [Candidatus Ozemobacteraceae bacterium]|nr:D-glycerate dehydrogenase [Candidatus Ozemobacteraceae bacterium]